MIFLSFLNSYLWFLTLELGLPKLIPTSLTLKVSTLSVDNFEISPCPHSFAEKVRSVAPHTTSRSACELLLRKDDQVASFRVWLIIHSFAAQFKEVLLHIKSKLDVIAAFQLAMQPLLPTSLGHFSCIC